MNIIRCNNSASKNIKLSHKKDGLVLTSSLPKKFVWQSQRSLDVNPSYAELINLLEINPSTLEYKQLGYRAWNCEKSRCSVDTVYLPLVNCGKYHIWNSFKHSSRCVSKIIPKVDFMAKRGSDNLICFDLTIPRNEAHLKDIKKTIERLRKAVNYFLDRLRHWLFPSKTSKLGGFYTIHLWKSSKPLDFHFHIHLQLFNVAFNDNQFYRFNPKLKSRLVRWAWLDCLKEFGLWVGSVHFLPNVHIHFIPMTDKPRLVHRIRYVYRKPIEDMNKNLVPSDLVSFDAAFVRYLMNYTPSRVFIGFCREFAKLGYICRKSVSLICPVCGYEMKKGEFFAHLDNIPIYIQVKSNMWCYVGGVK